MTRTAKFFVIASVALNVVLIGLVLGHAAHRFGPHFPHGIQQAVRMLPEDKQAEFKDTMQQLYRENRGTWKQMRQSRQATMRILQADHFNRDAYEAEMKKLQRMADAIASLAEHWSPEDRQALAAMLHRGRHRYHHTSKEAPEE